MFVKALTPILNVSDIQASFTWFENLGWGKSFEWGDPVGFGGVCCGEVEIFLCEGAQGGRGKGTNTQTFNAEGGEKADKGVWMSLWVDDIDVVVELCKKHAIDVVFPLTEMPWNVTEMHIRHPDGHVFRVSKAIENQ